MTTHFAWVAVAPAAEVPDGTVLGVEADGVALAVFNIDGVLHAYERWCPHRAGDLCGATIYEGAVVCPDHFWRFDLTTGECRTSASRPLDRYPVRVVDGTVEVSATPMTEQ
jgi:nitrite reductase/ring-hydroxylating ferredoxin subunit